MCFICNIFEILRVIYQKYENIVGKKTVNKTPY